MGARRFSGLIAGSMGLRYLIWPRTVAQALFNRQWIKDITGPLTVQVLLEYLQIWEQMHHVQLHPQPDRV